MRRSCAAAAELLRSCRLLQTRWTARSGEVDGEGGGGRGGLVLPGGRRHPPQVRLAHPPSPCPGHALPPRPLAASSRARVASCIVRPCTRMAASDGARSRLSASPSLTRAGFRCLGVLAGWSQAAALRGSRAGLPRPRSRALSMCHALGRLFLHVGLGRNSSR